MISVGSVAGCFFAQGFYLIEAIYLNLVELIANLCEPHAGYTLCSSRTACLILFLMRV